MSVAPGAWRTGDPAPQTVLEIVSNAIVGGMETAVLRLVSHLPSRGFRVEALCPFHSAFTEALAGVVDGVHIAPMGDRLRWHTVQMATGLARDRRVDVIHTHLWAAHQVGALAGRLAGVPVVATAHGMHITMQDLEAHLLGRTHLCVVSEAARAHALAVGARAARVHVVRNGVDVTAFAPRGARDATGPVTIGYVGRFSPEKHPQLFVRAAARVRRECPGARFIMVGDGPLRAELAALAQRLHVDEALTFTGIRTDMADVYASLDILALTSWHEGTPLAVLEAMACGVPVVATSVGGVPELVAVGVTGLLSRPGDDAAFARALCDLCLDRARRAAFGHAARARAVGEFGLSRHVDATAALLRSVTARPEAARRTVQPLRSARPDA